MSSKWTRIKATIKSKLSGFYIEFMSILSDMQKLTFPEFLVFLCVSLLPTFTSWLPLSTARVSAPANETPGCRVRHSGMRYTAWVTMCAVSGLSHLSSVTKAFRSTRDIIAFLKCRTELPLLVYLFYSYLSSPCSRHAL